MALVSGNSFGMSHWSDYKVIAPNNPKVSPVQKCLVCGKYFVESEQPYSFGKTHSSNRGELSYEEWKDAYNQFANDESVDNVVLSHVMFWLIQAYNDYYFRPDYRTFPNPPVDPQEEAFITNIIYRFIEIADKNEVPLALIAEFYREAGDMEKSLQVLSSINLVELNKMDFSICAGVKKRICTGNRRVFHLFCIDNPEWENKD